MVRLDNRRHHMFILDAVDQSVTRQALRTAIAAQKYLREKVKNEPKAITGDLVDVLDADIAMYENLLTRLKAVL